MTYATNAPYGEPIPPAFSAVADTAVDAFPVEHMPEPADESPNVQAPELPAFVDCETKTTAHKGSGYAEVTVAYHAGNPTDGLEALNAAYAEARRRIETR